MDGETEFHYNCVRNLGFFPLFSLEQCCMTLKDVHVIIIQIAVILTEQVFFFSLVDYEIKMQNDNLNTQSNKIQQTKVRKYC